MSSQEAARQDEVQEVQNEQPPGVLAMIAHKRIRKFMGQPRRYFDPEKMKELARSIRSKGQKVPIEVKPIVGDPEADYELVDGERRWLACGMAEVPTMLAWVKEIKDAEEQFVDSVVSNFGREGHTPLETAHAIVRIMANKSYAGLTRTAQIKQAADLFARSSAWIYQHLNLLNLHPEVQQMLEPTARPGHRLSFSVAVYLNNIRDLALQLEVAKEIAEKDLKLNKARALVRKRMNLAGIKPDGRGRRPSDDFKIFERFVERLSEDAERVLEMPMKEFKKLLTERRDPEERRTLLARLDESLARLQEFRDALAGAK